MSVAGSNSELLIVRPQSHEPDQKATQELSATSDKVLEHDEPVISDQAIPKDEVTALNPKASPERAAEEYPLLEKKSVDKEHDYERDQSPEQETSFSPFLTLPNELIQFIAEGTDFELEGTADLINLRTTCRTIQFATRHLFIRSYFHTGTLVLQKNELSRFASLVDKSDIAQAVRNIYVSRSRTLKCARLTTRNELGSEIAAALSKIPNIKGMHFTSCTIGNVGLPSTCACISQFEYFEMVMKAAERCKYRLEELEHMYCNLRQASFKTSKLARILRSNTALSMLKTLKLRFEFPGPLDEIELDEDDFASQVVSGLNNLTTLENLHLGFPNSTHLSSGPMEIFADTLHLPNLAKLTLTGVVCRINDKYNVDSLWDLLAKRSRTLRHLELCDLFISMSLSYIVGTAESRFSTMLANLRDGLSLDSFKVFNIHHANGEVLGFPDLIPRGKPRNRITASFVQLEGKQEVQAGMKKMVEGLMLDCSDFDEPYVEGDAGDLDAVDVVDEGADS